MLRRWLIRPIVDHLEELSAIVSPLVSKFDGLISTLDQIEHRVLTLAGSLQQLTLSAYPSTITVLWNSREGDAPGCASLTVWLANGEEQQHEVPLMTSVPKGSWVVVQGPALLSGVHVGAALQDLGGARYAGRCCVLGQDVALGVRLSVRLKQPERGANYRS